MSQRVFVAHFDSAEALLAAARAARAAGFRLHEAFTPVPIPELDALLPAHPPRLRGALITGLAVAGAALGLQGQAAFVNWPEAAGAPYPWPRHLPVALAVGALACALVIAGQLIGHLIRRSRPLSADRPPPPPPRVLEDRFVLAVSIQDARFDRDEAAALLDRHGALESGYAEVAR